MKTTLTTTILTFFFFIIAHTQPSLSINGFADTYWKYDFAERENIGTYFANDHNSISLGMLGLGLQAQAGKASLTTEVSFGPRGQYLSIPQGDSNDPSNDFNIQNLYMQYMLTNRLSLTAGYMGTFVGYEVISPASNFHYSTSYLFGAGPFQNAGLKARYTFTDAFSLMAGVFNDWNVYQDLNGLSHFGAQLTVSPSSSFVTNLNVLTGRGTDGDEDYSSGTLLDLVLNWTLTPKFSLGGNVASYWRAIDGGYHGVAAYPQYRLSEAFALGLRTEYFEMKKTADTDAESYLSATLSGNFKHGGLTFIPELRLDNSQGAMFMNKSGEAVRNASQFSIAAVYAFKMDR